MGLVQVVLPILVLQDCVDVLAVQSLGFLSAVCRGQCARCWSTWLLSVRRSPLALTGSVSSMAGVRGKKVLWFGCSGRAVTWLSLSSVLWAVCPLLVHLAAHSVSTFLMKLMGMVLHIVYAKTGLVGVLEMNESDQPTDSILTPETA